MTAYVDQKYINLLAPKLRNFKKRGDFLWNFSCPVCGDSSKDNLKSRGYVYKRKDKFLFHPNMSGHGGYQELHYEAKVEIQP